MLIFNNPYSTHRPPGSDVEFLSHPAKQNGVIELALFQEHRYAFFYWLIWTRESNIVPCLVSYDWHRDLCFPSDNEKKWLDKLDQSNNGDVALFCWAKLNGNNDGHILSAAYLNLIGNIYVLCRQGKYDRDWQDEQLIDKYGNIHLIKKFKSPETLEEYLNTTNETDVYFDIDLDYFTLNNPYNGQGKKFTYMKREDIFGLLSPKNLLIKWIFDRICGFTIATEPEHCGGLLKSNKLLNTISSIYFKPEIFAKNCDWKHKKRENEGF